MREAVSAAACKGAVDLVEYIQGKGVKLRRQGKSFVGLCPFHADKKPSFSVDPEKSLWHCFGCGKGGDLFTFLQELEGVSFAQALKELGGQPGDIPAPGRQSAASHEILTRVVAFYHQTFYDDPRGLAYLRDTRGIHDKEIYETFRPGFANGSLFKTLPKSGEIIETLKALGILTSSGREFFHHHVIFPLTNEDGQVVGIYGRSIENGPATPHLYLKGPHRGVFNWQAAKRSSDLFLTESIIDALSLYQAGFRDVLSLYGVNGLTSAHIDLFRNYRTKKIILVLDNDAAGAEACPRIAEALSPIACARVMLPCKDANDFFRGHGAEDFAALCRQAVPVAAARVEEPVAAEPLDDGFILSCGVITYRVKVLSSFDERLRVTIKVLSNSSDPRSFLDTLDLYSHRSRQAAATQIAKRFNLSREKVETHFFSLIEETERLRQERVTRERGALSPKGYVMSDEEREEAHSFLASSTLAQEIIHDLEILGYVGEDPTKLLAYLIGISRKLDRPLSGIISSSSGAGKSRLSELIESLTPPEDVILYSRLSPQALGYMEKDSLKRKLLIIEERKGSEAADYSIRTLQTRQKLTQGVVIKDPSTGRMYTKTFTVEGPIAYLETTTNGALNPENSTRCFELYLDESKEQTEKVHETQRNLKTLDGFMQGEAAQRIIIKHQNAQRLLESVKVVIPYAPLLTFPSEWLRTRRDNERFLSLIEAVCFLHQHQREVKRAGENSRAHEYCEATLNDYALAYDLAKDVLSHTLHDLAKSSRELFEEIIVMAGEKAARCGREPHEVVLTRRDIREHAKWSDRKLKECLAQLVDLEYLLVIGGAQGKLYCYQLPEGVSSTRFSLCGLISPGDLEKKLTGGGGQA
jgi:DNA primase